MEKTFRIISILTLFILVNCVSADEKIKTVITGEKMEMREGGKVVVFSQGAKATRGENILKADRMVQNKRNGDIKATGNVYFETFSERNELILGRGGKAFYNTNTGLGELWEDRPHIEYYTEGSTTPVVINADKIDFNKQNQVDATGNVEIISSSASAYSHRALFYQGERRLILTSQDDQPRIIYRAEGRHDRFRADEITVLFKEKRIILEGNAFGVVKNLKNSKTGN